MNSTIRKINDGIKGICKDDNVLLESITSTISNGVMKIVINISPIDDNKNRYEKDYIKYANQLCMNPVWINTLIYYRGKSFKLIGYDTKKTKKCIVIINALTKEKKFIDTEKARKMWIA